MLDQNAVFIFSVNNPDPGLHRSRDSYSGKNGSERVWKWYKKSQRIGNRWKMCSGFVLFFLICLWFFFKCHIIAWFVVQLLDYCMLFEKQFQLQILLSASNSSAFCFVSDYTLIVQWYFLPWSRRTEHYILGYNIVTKEFFSIQMFDSALTDLSP